MQVNKGATAGEFDGKAERSYWPQFVCQGISFNDCYWMQNFDSEKADIRILWLMVKNRPILLKNSFSEAESKMSAYMSGSGFNGLGSWLYT